jgi:hypothetical protein
MRRDGGRLFRYTRCIVDLTWAEVPVQVEYQLFEARGPGRILTSVTLRFSEADVPRIREALRAEYKDEGRPVMACCPERTTSDTWWSGPATEAYLLGTKAIVSSREHGELARQKYLKECDRQGALCEP